MSDRPCNKCELERMTREARKVGKRIVIVPVSPKKDSYRLGGSDVFRVKQGQKPSSANWACWFMEIPSTCQC